MDRKTFSGELSVVEVGRFKDAVVAGDGNCHTMGALTLGSTGGPNAVAKS